jgi:transcriptional regulator with XRE-family HTH domain
MQRSLRVSHDCIEKAGLAVKRNGYYSQRILAEDVGLSLSTVNNFLTGKSVYYSTFVELCSCLGLDWREIADLSSGYLEQKPDDFINFEPKKNCIHLEISEPVEHLDFYSQNSEELVTLSQWIIQESCRLLSQISITEIERIDLLIQLKEQVQSDFEVAIEQSQRSNY